MALAIVQDYGNSFPCMGSQIFTNAMQTMCNNLHCRAERTEAPRSYTICFGPAVNKLQRHYGKQSLLPQLPILLTPRRGEERPKEETGEEELGYGKEEGETRTEKTDT